MSWFKIQIPILLLVFAMTGCKTSSRVSYFQHTLKLHQNDDLSAETLVTQTPVIDIHSHNFNARDIPIQNIALGRRDVLPPWSWFISDTMAKLLAAAILAETEPEDEAEKVLYQSKSANQRVREAARTVGLDEKTADTITTRSQYRAVHAALDYAVTKTYPPMHFKEEIVLRSIAAFATHEPAGFLRKSIHGILEEIGGFLGDLTLADAELAREYWKENSTSIHFRIVHMMDMGATYGQESSPEEMHPFEKQIEKMEQLQADPATRMAYFVAYNPFRDNKYPGQAMDLIRRAIEGHRAYGVKIYPPAGYRPISNQIPPRPGCRITSQPGRQWDYRYKRDGVKISDAELDERLLTLLCWCASNDVPVFAHCGYGEFQARGGYGAAMANPHWWQEFFEKAGRQHPELLQLRLCLGHAGGGDGFFGVKEFKAWSEAVVDLCRKYPNVYCEVGCLDAILDCKQQAAFAAAMDELCHLSKDAEHNYSFGSKMMYGSDWFMPIQTGVDRHNFLAQYQRVFLLPGLRTFYKPFFLGNALAYLNADQRINDPHFPMEPETKIQLQRLIADAQRR